MLMNAPTLRPVSENCSDFCIVIYPYQRLSNVSNIMKNISKHLMTPTAYSILLLLLAASGQRHPLGEQSYSVSLGKHNTRRSMEHLAARCLHRHLGDAIRGVVLHVVSAAFEGSNRARAICLGHSTHSATETRKTGRTILSKSLYWTGRATGRHQTLGETTKLPNGVRSFLGGSMPHTTP